MIDVVNCKLVLFSLMQNCSNQLVKGYLFQSAEVYIEIKSKSSLLIPNTILENIN